MFHRALSGDFFFVVSRRRSGSSDIRVASVALVTDDPALRYTKRPPSPSTSETKNKTDHRQSCLPTSSPYHIQHFDRHSQCKPSRTASSSCYPARVTQGIFPANVLVRSMALAHCHLLSIMFSRRGRNWNAAGRDLLLPRYPRFHVVLHSTPNLRRRLARCE